jgi:hypothetical protein
LQQRRLRIINDMHGSRRREENDYYAHSEQLAKQIVQLCEVMHKVRFIF